MLVIVNIILLLHLIILLLQRYYGDKIRVEFDGSYLKQEKAIFNHKTVRDIYIFYEKTYKQLSNTGKLLVWCS